MFKFFPQFDQMGCGPACVAMVASVHNKDVNYRYIRENTFISKEGVSLLNISEVAKKIGFNTHSTLISISQLIENKSIFPVILHWNQNHFVVLIKVRKGIFNNNNNYFIADPAHGVIKLNEAEFKKSWLSQVDLGVALFLSPNEQGDNYSEPVDGKLDLKYVLSFLNPYKRQIAKMSLLLFLGSCLTLIFPFLTQTLIDKGVTVKDLHVITIVLLAQLSLYLGSLIIEVIRNSILLYVGTKISITIISDFLQKLLKLPIKFFDSKMMGDFQQRIQDNERIESFLTSQSLTTFFSIITFSVFFGVLWYYNFRILIIFLILTIISVFWSLFWLKKIKILDYFKFQYRSENQQSIYEIINGITELKINQFENLKLQEWEEIQQKLFLVNVKLLKFDQVQLSGFDFINQTKNILVTFMSALFVVQGQMTLGELLSVSYIVGQMNSPVNQLVNFFRSLQNAKLSLERLNEVQDHPQEENDFQKKMLLTNNTKSDGDINFKNVSFQYDGPNSPLVLEDINLTIPTGKVTAIVGSSGSGKTTLIKLLLRFYDPCEGQILYNGVSTLLLSPSDLRKNCGVVMQDGYIFSDSIKRNIATGDQEIDEKKYREAIKIANIEEFIDSLPLGCNTKIGSSGNGISGGQKQRILIARAVYKNPHYIFLDEATSALDAENEKIIHNNLHFFFQSRTAVIIAHRLSTVKNADQIIVLKDGQIVEIGQHDQLVKMKGSYFNLIRNQLELGQ